MLVRGAAMRKSLGAAATFMHSGAEKPLRLAPDRACLSLAMLPLEITVSVGPRRVPVHELADARLASALRSAGEDIARRLEGIRCPLHRKTAIHVRVHFDERGGADLQYDSCCESLGARIGASLG
jgi:hypothetical protein